MVLTLKFEGEIDEQIEDLLTPPVEFNGSAYARNSQNIGAEVDEIPPPLPKSSPPPLPTKPPPIGRKVYIHHSRAQLYPNS